MNRIGKYSILEELGSGSHGVIYKAIDLELDRIVALKLLSNSRYDAKKREYFIKEAKALAKHSHPNIVTLYDLIESDGNILLVLQHIDGENLSSILNKSLTSIDIAVKSMVALASALSAAHGFGMCHGDIKPDNIMVDKENIPYLVDFGLARFWNSDDLLLTRLSSSDGLTPSLEGTLPYMAPERIMGHPSDYRSDIFSLGAVFYEMLSGRRAFAGDNQATVLNAILNAHPPDIVAIRPQTPAWLGRLIDDMLVKAPERRVGSVAMVQTILINQDSVDVSNRPAAQPSIISDPAPRRPQYVATLKWATLVMTFVILSWLGALAFGYEVRPVSFRMANGINLIENFDKRNAVEDAKTLFSGILSADPNHAGAEAGMALALMREYTSKESDPATLRRATTLAKSALDSDPQQGLANIAAAWAAEYNGDFARANQLYDAASALDPGNALIFEGRARLFKKQNDLSSASAILQAAIKARPEQRIFYDAYGEIFAIRGDFKGAERLFRQGLSVAPDNMQGYANLAQSLHMQGKTKDAIKAVQDGLKIGENSDLYNNLGTYLFFQGQYEKAVEAFERALGLDGNSHDYLAWANLADAQRYVPSMAAKSRDSYRRAIQLLRKDLARRPRDEGLNSRLALFAAKADDRKAAESALAIATRAATKDPRTYYRAMITHDILGSRQIAMAYLRRALAAGYPLAEIENDPDLAQLRQDPAYQLTISKWEDE